MATALLAQAPALPLGDAGGYVAAAYIVFVLLLIVYVGIMAAKLARISRDLEELASLAENRRDRGQGTGDRDQVESVEQSVAAGRRTP